MAEALSNFAEVSSTPGDTFHNICALESENGNIQLLNKRLYVMSMGGIVLNSRVRHYCENDLEMFHYFIRIVPIMFTSWIGILFLLY